MRLKLSFTVEEEDVYKEAAMILAMATGDMKHAIDMFENIQKELSTTTATPDIEMATTMMSDLRRALLKVDVRTVEVNDILVTYQEHLDSVKERDRVEQNLREMPQPPSIPAPASTEDREILEAPDVAHEDESL